MASNGLLGWPNKWPRYNQDCFPAELCSDTCDMLIGPCACGAWHQRGEFELKKDGLYRYGIRVLTLNERRVGLPPV